MTWVWDLAQQDSLGPKNSQGGSAAGQSSVPPNDGAQGLAGTTGRGQATRAAQAGSVALQWEAE